MPWTEWKWPSIIKTRILVHRLWHMGLCCSKGNTHLFWDLIWRKNMDTYASPMEYVHKVVKFESHSTCSCISYWPMSTSMWYHSYNIMSKPPSYPSVWSTLSFLYLYWFNIMSLQEDLWWSGQGMWIEWMKKTTYQGSHTSISICTRRRDKRKAILETPRTTRKQR